ncbi:MAG: DUF4097 family beta strand repeat protein [Candidatus Aminicenantes bacterium]|nr:DUF4097 family beta strand repeat protein [Candidatus Aminicenantes bacterium]
MKNVNRVLFVLLVLGLVAPTLCAQEAADRVVVPLSDPGKPGIVKAHLINGAITVTGYGGKEVIVEARPRGKVVPAEEKSSSKHPGMKRLRVSGGGLQVEERQNLVEIEVPAWKADVDLVIQVPVATSLQLHSVNNGGIQVENISGEIEVENVNGSITLTRISGSVVAQTVNGNVTAAFLRLEGQKPLSLVTLNGDVDLTLPASTKADLKMRIDNNGEIYSDFELQLQEKTDRSVRDEREKGGRFRVTIDRSVQGSINGGGREITLKTFNGDILLRKAK